VQLDAIMFRRPDAKLTAVTGEDVRAEGDVARGGWMALLPGGRERLGTGDRGGVGVCLIVQI
jgi:hypothetical protein